MKFLNIQMEDCKIGICTMFFGILWRHYRLSRCKEVGTETVNRRRIDIKIDSRGTFPGGGSGRFVLADTADSCSHRLIVSRCVFNV